MNNKLLWYKTFFTGLALDLWVGALPEDFTSAEVDFIVNTTGLSKGSKLLDVPCGFGRHALPLARKGYQVTGVDIAEPYIHQVKDAARIEKLPVTVMQGDFFDLTLKDTFDACICMGNSFSYFPFEGMVAFMRKIGEALRPGSLFIANTGMLAESILPRLEKETHMTVGDIEFYIENEYRSEESVLQTNMRFVRGNQEEKGTSYHFAFTASELTRMLKSVGFSDVKIYSGVQREPYQLGDAQAYIVSRK
jgi:SAM-dependent methyltransferase